MPDDVFIGIITPGTVQLECVESLISVIVTKQVKWAKFHRSPPYLDDARNELLLTFHEAIYQDCDRILMVDSDIEFTPEDIHQLVVDDLPIVSGVYWSDYGPHGGLLPVVYDWTERDDGKRSMVPIREWADGPLTQVEFDEPVIQTPGVGAGFLMIKREVLDAMRAVYPDPQPWFAEDVINGVHFGEDLCFCIRAAECGFPVHVDRRVQLAHHKHARIAGLKVTQPLAV